MATGSTRGRPNILRWALAAMLASCCLLQAVPVTAQSGEAVYARVADSIFFLQVRDDAGQLKGSGSAFLVDADLLLTNAHVVAGGLVFVRMGPLEVPCKVEREDKLNDLATCRLQARTSSRPLNFAKVQPNSGSKVFAVGNPRGLERTITEGVVSGRRVIEGAEMLQISASISPGSSGGPVLNAEGDVIGVVAASLPSGQNLNFAVPLDIVRDFIEGKEIVVSPDRLVGELRVLEGARERLAYSTEAGSDWSTNEGKIRSLLLQGVEGINEPDPLSLLYPIAVFWHRDVAVTIAERVISLRKTVNAEDFRRLARAAYDAADKGADDEQALLASAESAIRKAIETVKGQDSEDFGLLGDIQNQQGRSSESLAAYATSNSVARTDEERLNASERLFRLTRRLGRNEEAYRWMTTARKFKPSVWSLSSFADFLGEVGKNEESGLLYWDLYLAQPTSYRWACEAGSQLWRTDRLDDSLLANRKCLELAALKKGAATDVGRAHRIISAILIERGVYEEAASHAQNAIAIDPKDAFAHYYLGQSYEAQRRFDDAILVLKNAIRLSDGKFFSMHFSLGSVYFELKRWPEAAQAYEKASELAPQSANAAYNVAASYYNNRQYSAALPWYREVLKRDPKHPDRSDILATISKIGGTSRPLPQ